MSKLSTEFCHLVYLVNALASKEVKTIKVFCVSRNLKHSIWILHRHYSLEDDALAFLNPLTHRVKVGSEVNSCREDTLAVLAFRLSIELLPPLAKIVELRLVVGDDFYLLACLVDSIANSSIDSSWILLYRSVEITLSLHVLSTLYE